MKPSPTLTGSFKPVQSGAMRHRVIIQIQGPLDANGQPNPEWQNLDTVWAHIEATSGQKSPIQAPFDQAAAGRTQFGPMETHRVTMRYYSGFDASCRLLFGTRVFEILAVLNREEKNLVLDVICRERLGVSS